MAKLSAARPDEGAPRSATRLAKKLGFTPTHEGDFYAKTALTLPIGKVGAVFNY